MLFRSAGIIYPVKESEWVSPVHCVPKKGGFTVEANENHELVPIRTIVGYRMCIDFRKLNKAGLISKNSALEVGGAIGVHMKSLLFVLGKSHNLVFSGVLILAKTNSRPKYKK